MEWCILEQHQNLGFGAGVNIGFRAAVADGCDVLVTLNPDARLTSDVLDALVAQAIETPTALIAPRLVDSMGGVFFSGSTLDLRSGRLRSGFAKGNRHCVDWVTAACLVVHARGWAASGGFDPDYFLYWEDVDFSYRSWQAGLDLVVRHDLIALHDEGGTQDGGRRRKSNLYYRYCCRNRLLFAAKQLPVGKRVRWLLMTPRESAAIYLRGGRRQLLTSPSGALAAAHGTIEGVGLLLRSLPRRPRASRHRDNGGLA
jgi:GT2 family glycosyltransferase